MTDTVLVADIGGTNARFALARIEQDAVAISHAQTFRAKDFATICDAACAYLETISTKPVAACIAVAGPVTDDEIEFTNSSWVLKVAELKQALNLDQFLAVNDFEALAAGVRHLKEEDFLTVKAGQADPSAPMLVMGPGTGFGQALIVPFGEQPRVIATEGGHVAFAPHTDEEIAVVKYLMREHPRVSVERLLSGEGLVNIYDALCTLNGENCTPLHAEEITAAAMEGSNPMAVKAVGLFCDVLGRVAGDGALATGARGGIVLGGGILPKIRELFLESAFTERFLAKGRMRSYMADIPVRMIIREGAALIGAGAMAKEAFFRSNVCR